MRLLGARKFIGLPAGTIYKEYWLRDVAQCKSMIKEFQQSPERFSGMEDLLIYFNNGGSLILCCRNVRNGTNVKMGKDIILTDINVVGDADPTRTLRVVFEPEEIPDYVTIMDEYDDEEVCAPKSAIMQISDMIRKERDSVELDDWARDELERLSANGNEIIDTDITVTLEQLKNN